MERTKTCKPLFSSAYAEAKHRSTGPPVFKTKRQTLPRSDCRDPFPYGPRGEPIITNPMVSLTKDWLVVWGISLGLTYPQKKCSSSQPNLPFSILFAWLKRVETFCDTNLYNHQSSQIMQSFFGDPIGSRNFPNKITRSIPRESRTSDLASTLPADLLRCHGTTHHPEFTNNRYG